MHEFDFSDLVKEQSDSVVNIESTRKVLALQGLSVISQKSFLESLDFHQFLIKECLIEGKSTGSGFVVSTILRYILTNYHVVQGAQEVVG